MQALLLFLFPALLAASVAQAARLVNFQVTQPPIVPENTKQCTVKLIECVSIERWDARLC